MGTRCSLRCYRQKGLRLISLEVAKQSVIPSSTKHNMKFNVDNRENESEKVTGIIKCTLRGYSISLKLEDLLVFRTTKFSRD